MASDGDLYTPLTDIIPLTGIDHRNESFRITTRHDTGELQQSIGRLGLLVPPLILEHSDGGIILSGFRRVAACRHLGWSRIPARLLPIECDRYDCARRAVGENSTQRTLNLIETSRALGLLEDHAPGRIVPAEDLAALGLPQHPDVISKVKALCQLPSAVLEGILEGSISFAMACELGRLEESLAVGFAGLFHRLKISLNKQRDIVCLTMEIAHREGISGLQVLEEPGLVRLLSAEDLDRSQKARQLRHQLRQRRFPALHTAEANFQQLRRDLKLEGDLQLSHPRDFEGTVFTLTLSFENQEDLRRFRKRLDALLDHPDLKTILEAKGSRFAVESRSKRERDAAGAR
jgi:ParB family transcriptional regulator, chromosome partitioning protein